MIPDLFFKKYGPLAKAACKNTNVLPSVSLAQAALESSWGESKLAKDCNNLGGVKAFESWRGQRKTYDTKEFLKGKWVNVKAAFRMYPTAKEYFADRVWIFQLNSRYKSLFKDDDFRSEAKYLAASGWATDPDYGKKLVSIVTKYKLYTYDM